MSSCYAVLLDGGFIRHKLSKGGQHADFVVDAYPFAVQVTAEQ